MRSHQLCKELKLRRIQKQMTQKDLAKKLGYQSSQFVSNWERELCNPPWEILPLICRLLGVSQSRATAMVLSDLRKRLDSSFRKIQLNRSQRK